MKITQPNDVTRLEWERHVTRFLQAQKGTTAQRPVLGPDDSGFLYFDTTLAAAGKPIWWTGAAWADATGAEV